MYNDPAEVQLYLSGITLQSPTGVSTRATFGISGAGSGLTTIRMNHCVLELRDNGPALELTPTGPEGTEVEMFHCRIRNKLATFTGPALVVLEKGSLTMKEADVKLVNLAERSFLASDASKLIIDNAEIKGPIETRDSAYLQLTQSAIDSGALPCIEHNGGTAIALDVLFISTQAGDVVAGSGEFRYNSVGYFYSLYFNQTLAASLSGGAGALPIGTENARNLIYRAATAANWAGFGGVPANVNLALDLLVNRAAAPAGGDLTGIYPNPQIAAGVIVDADVNASANITGSKVAAATTTSPGTVRLATSTETTAGLAVQASDTRLSNLRPPGGAAGGDLTGLYPNPQIAVGVIVDADVNASANITGSKVAAATTTSPGTVRLATSTETTAGLAVQASDTRLSNSRPPGGTAGGDLTGTYPNPQIAAGVIVDADVNASANIAGTKLADNAITSAKIADNAVTSVKIANYAVTSAKIANGTIVDADISASANIAGSKINPVFDRQAQFTRADGTYSAPDFNVYGATRLYQTHGTLFPTIINPDFQVDGTTLHGGEVASKGGFWAAQMKYARFDAIRVGASVYGFGDTAHGSMTVEGSLAVGLGGPGDTGNWASYPTIGNIYKSGTVCFRIVHPVDTNKFLIHRATESPLAELIYRGKAQLANGVASINLNTYYGLMPHTLDSILTNLSVCVYNNAGWTRVRCPAVAGVSFVIEAEATNCNDIVEWFAIGKRIGENVSDDIELDE